MPNIDYKLHDQLNPKIWNNYVLRPDVRLASMKIALEFYKFLQVDIKIVDVVISGSQANYNYTEHSDLDLHLIVDYSQVQCEYPVDELFDTKRLLWKEQHDITIHNIPVELYVEDTANPAVSSSYSIIKDQWIDEPKKQIKNIDNNRVRSATQKWSKLIKFSLHHNDLGVIRKTKDLLKMYRQSGLSREGEFSVPNLVYKTLRNEGYIRKLMDAIRSLQDAQLSI